MDHLLDTNALIFFLEDSPRLSSKNAELIESPKSMSFISLASLWEISLKASLGKLQVSYRSTTARLQIYYSSTTARLQLNYS